MKRDDIRWLQRFQHFERAFISLRELANLAQYSEIEIDAAKRSAEERDGPFFEGFAIGIFLRHMDRQMDGRFIQCMHKAK